MSVVCLTLDKSYKKSCKASIAGIQAASFGVYDTANRLVTTSAGVVDVATVYGTGTLARFEVKNTTAKYLENGTKGLDTNAKSVKGAVTFNIAIPPDIATHIEKSKVVDTLMDREWVIFLEMKDGTILPIGSQFGAEILTAEGDTGGMDNDLNGYIVNITTNEPDFARKYALSGDGLVDYAAALMAY